ncbi:MAG TPA: c-type cytochrome, partial [Chitinophagaceae bacterium]|nr:c-type cytochrome [Chitinophagaceae bacterium]
TNFYVKHADEKLPMPSPGDSIAMGAYLVNAADCQGCHSPVDSKKFDFKMDAWLSGGNVYRKPKLGFNVASANITPDSATGIGTWTEEMFLNKFRSYRDPKNYNFNPGKYNTIMPWTVLANMRDEDIRYIYTYLRSIKRVKNSVNKWPD